MNPGPSMLEPDSVDCGAGDEDTVWYDEHIDEVKNCEIHNPDGSALLAPLNFAF